MTKTTARCFSIIFFVIAVLFSCMAVTFASEKTVTVLLDGNQLSFDIEPILEKGRTLVPMRVIFEALGADITWNNETRTATATKNDIKIEITVNSNKMLKNGEVIELDIPARLRSSRTLVPVRAVSEGLGAKVDWDNDLWQVIITGSPEYKYNELSAADMELLKSESAMIRREIIYNSLPDAIFSMEEYSSGTISSQNPALRRNIPELWDSFVAQNILRIQIESKDSYIFNNVGPGKTRIDAYKELASKAVLDSDSMFTAIYDVTASGRLFFLLDFKVCEKPSDCKYIAIIPDGNTVRYFTAERAPEGSTSNVYTFFEVSSDLLINQTYILPTKADFLKTVDAVMNSETSQLPEEDEEAYDDEDDVSPGAAEIEAVEAFVKQIAPSLRDDFASQAGDSATIDMRAEKTTVVINVIFTVFTSEELGTLDKAELKEMANQLNSSGELLETLQTAEPAIDALSIEFCGNDGTVVYTKKFR